MCKVSLIRLKCPYSCFSTHLCFLVISGLLLLVLSILFRVAVISLPLRFSYSLRVVVLMCQRCLQCWLVLFLLLFLTHIICQPHLWDARPYAWLLVFLFSDPFVKGFLWSTSRMVPSILRGGQPRYVSLIIIIISFLASFSH